MSPVVWGLDLAEIQWSKFKSSYMWNSDYHLRRTKFIVYQCALIFCVVSESLGTDVLSNYVDQQRYIQSRNSQANQYNNDYVGIASYNIWCGVFTAFVFGAAFFFDLFWPERHENKSVRLAWKICGVLAVVFGLADAIAYTVIVALRSAYVTGVGQDEADRLVAGADGYPMVYRLNPRAVASVVILWPGWLSTLGR